MKTFEEYYKEVKKNVVDQWKKEGHAAFVNMENDPVIDLLIKALSYQAFYIQKNIDQYKGNVLEEFRDRIIPANLIKPIPAFSIVETKITKTPYEAIGEKTVNETCVLEFKKVKFVPLLETKIINAELKNVNTRGQNVHVELQFAAPCKNLSGLSFYIDTPEPIDIETIRYDGYELPVIKPSQYNELPFTKWFNNAHLFLNQNYYLFGTYDYWQEIFLSNTAQLFYIGQYDTNKIPINDQTNIELKIVLNSYTNINDKIKINCIPVVNAEKKETKLNNRNPVGKLSPDTGGEFLNLLYDKENDENMKNYINSFLVRQYGVERYNPEQLLEQMREILYRYASDYYAFLSIDDLKNSDKLKSMQEVIDDISGFVRKFENDSLKNQYYAVLKKNEPEIKDIHLEYLSTSGESANGIKKGEKATRVPIYLDKNKTTLLLDTKGGRNSIKDESQKESMAKYYFQTKDRLITPADIRIFIKTFYYDENSKLGDFIDNITIKRESETIAVVIDLKKDSPLKNKVQSLENLEKILQNKITLRSSGVMSYQVKIRL